MLFRGEREAITKPRQSRYERLLPGVLVERAARRQRELQAAVANAFATPYPRRG